MLGILGVNGVSVLAAGKLIFDQAYNHFRIFVYITPVPFRCPKMSNLKSRRCARRRRRHHLENLEITKVIGVFDQSDRGETRGYISPWKLAGHFKPTVCFGCVATETMRDKTSTA